MENHAFLNNTLHPALGVLTGELIKSQFTQLCLTIFGICAMYLKNLINLGIVQKETPYSEKASRKSIYSIEDNMFRFWYRFVFENNSIIARGAAGNTILSGGYEQVSDVPKDILTELLSADEVYCEVPFCLANSDENHSITNGVMDVVYMKNDLWHIIDYKTNADARDLADEYVSQLDAYIKAFKSLTGAVTKSLTFIVVSSTILLNKSKSG